MRSWNHVLFVAALLTTATSSVSAGAESPVSLSSAQQTTYERALGYFRIARYSAAYGRFAQLADAGHAPSARIALLMVGEGVALFDSAWSASPGQLRRWQALAASAAALDQVSLAAEVSAE